MSKTEATGWVAKKGRWALNSRIWIGADHPAGPMLERWRLIQTPWFGIYVHFIHREDLDRVPHDHPWRFTSFVLRGGYCEAYRPDARVNANDVTRWHLRGSVHTFPLHAAHRITQVIKGTTTLVFVGRKCREWGFYDRFKWVPWQEADVFGLRANEGPAGSRPAGTPQLRSAPPIAPRWRRDGDGGASFEPHGGTTFRRA